MARSQQWYEDLSQSKRRRVQARMLAKGALVGVVILVGYYVLPLDSPGVSFDVDVCDPTIAPGVGTPVKGGLDYREAHMVMEIVADSTLLLALDVVEVNPVLDSQNATAILGAELALSALGQKII